MIYRASKGIAVLDLAAVFCASVGRVALQIGGAFLEEGQYVRLERGKIEYRRAEEGDISALRKNRAEYTATCKKYCVPFLYLGMPLEK